jgi:hypothetical protein
MPRFLRERARLAIFGVVAALAGLALGVALAVADGEFVRTAGPADPKRDDERRAALLAPFRASAEPVDALSPSAINAIHASADKQPGEDPRRSRIIQPAAGKTAFLWPMADGLCYGSPGPSGCFPLALLEKRGVVLGSSGYTAAGEIKYAHIFGIATDEVSEVRIRVDTGGTVVVPVRDNGLWVELSATPLSASWTFQGTVHTQEPLVRAP